MTATNTLAYNLLEVITRVKRIVAKVLGRRQDNKLRWLPISILN
jgi:hypothetical protein